MTLDSEDSKIKRRSYLKKAKKAPKVEQVQAHSKTKLMD
jgi:hypothetical protein